MFIYVLILLMGIITALISKYIFKSGDKPLCLAFIYVVIYYYVIVTLRSFISDGSSFLSYSFYGKSYSGYIKAIVLCIAVYCGIRIIEFLFKKADNNYSQRFECLISSFATTLVYLETLHVILIGQPNMWHIVIIGIIALVISVVTIILIKSKAEDNGNETALYRDKFILVAIPIAAYISMYILMGPAELMIYNKGDFVFSYLNVFKHIVCGILMFAPAIILIPRYTSDRFCKAFSAIISVFCILSYIQSILFNGKMSEIDGGIQEWSAISKASNLSIWIVAIVAMIAVFYRTNIGIRIVKYIVIYIACIQLLSFLWIVITGGIFHTSQKQLTEDGVFSLSEDNNVIVFILDAYDTQMLKYVTDQDPDYLNPLHDFTYYNNMVSRYTATDGSLPYLLTGADLDNKEIEEDQDNWYREGHFLQDIKNLGYDIRILTSKEYVDRLDEGLVDNYSADNYCKLDTEKVLNLLSRCMRYKSMPFILKTIFRYEEYDITNVITDTNVYIFGTDSEFDSRIKTEGISSDNSNGTFTIYHLYGAHSPYFLTENAERDYDSNPLAQWKGSLKIVYDYLDALHAVGLYDQTTVIVMADHGYNNTQRTAVKAAGLSCEEDKTNPIFFIKRAEESHDDLIIDSKQTTHDQFFDTILESMGQSGQYYGAVWDK